MEVILILLTLCFPSFNNLVFVLFSEQIATQTVPTGCKPTVKSVRLAVTDLAQKFPGRYKGAEKYLDWLGAIEKLPDGPKRDKELAELRREALLANPLLEGGAILLVSRKGPGSGLTSNWQGNKPLRNHKFDTRIAVLPMDDLQGELETIFVKPRWLFLKIHTDAGIVGLGEPVVEGRAQTVAAAIKEIGRYLIGEDPRKIEHHWQAIYRGQFCQRDDLQAVPRADIDAGATQNALLGVKDRVDATL